MKESSALATQFVLLLLPPVLHNFFKVQYQNRSTAWSAMKHKDENKYKKPLSKNRH